MRHFDNIVSALVISGAACFAAMGCAVPSGDESTGDARQAQELSADSNALSTSDPSQGELSKKTAPIGQSELAPVTQTPEVSQAPVPEYSPVTQAPSPGRVQREVAGDPGAEPGRVQQEDAPDLRARVRAGDPAAEQGRVQREDAPDLRARVRAGGPGAEPGRVRREALEQPDRRPY